MKKLEYVESLFCELKLAGAASCLKNEILSAQNKSASYLELVENILQKEIEYRAERRLKRNLAGAHFPVEKRLHSFDYKHCKGVTEKQLKDLLDFSFIDNHENILLMGPPGIGKTHLAIALSYEAVYKGYTVCFERMTNLIKLLKTVDVHRKYVFRINRILKSDLLIIDEIGYTPIDKKEANLFFNLISELYERSSVILTSNKDFNGWAEMMNDEVLTTAMLVRILHHAHVFSLSGDSYRVKKSKKEV
jgi:DNA replication protein DnaC